MGKQDTITKKYMREPNHFADFFNGYIYNGKEKIKAEDLEEVDISNIAVIPYSKGTKNITVQKYRDILKKVILKKSDKVYYLFLGIENQTDIHYAMPVRNMLYDALVYNQQIENIAKANRDSDIVTESDEFLSGITKKDKLIPVVTVVVYWGTKTWDAPVSLKEMLLDVDEETDVRINDYECNIFSIIDQDKLPQYHTELQELFALLNARNSGEKLHQLVVNNEAFKDIDKDTAMMMHEFANIKLPKKSKEGKYNMCKAIMDLEKENQDIKAVELIKNLMKTSKKSFEEACALLLITPADMKKYKKMI